MKPNSNFISILIFGLLGCIPKITLSLINQQLALSLEESVALLDVYHHLPEGDNTLVGQIRFQDSGFSTDCNFNSLLNRARQEARRHGANIVKIIEKRAPDLISTCYRLKIELYKYNGEVSDLKQYELNLD